MNQNIELEEDRKLDNKRQPISFELYNLSYIVGEEKVLIEKVEYRSRSGYCLDPVNHNRLSVSIRDIGKLSEGRLNGRQTIYEIYCYIHKIQEAFNDIQKLMLVDVKDSSVKISNILKAIETMRI